MAHSVWLRSAALVLLSLSALPGFTQKDSLRITGQVTSSGSKPVAWATIYLMDQDRPVYAGTAAANGSFHITVVQQRISRLWITAGGYQSLQRPLTEAELRQPNLDLGLLLLKDSGVSLQNVTVTAAIPLIKREPDRLVYNLEADPDSKTATVVDMMRKVPFITVDPDGNVQLKGNSDYKIFVNGKPSAMMDNNASNVLKTMPASTIQKIEVITHPSSKYDAEGISGIINIITIKKLLDGYSGSVNMNVSAPVGGPGAGMSFTAQSGKLGFNIFAGAGYNNAPEVKEWMTRRAQGNTVEQRGHSQSDGHNGYSGLELSFEADSLNLITAQLNWNGSRSTRQQQQHSAATLEDRAPQYDFANEGQGRSDGLDAGINYQRGFRTNKDRLLTASYKYLQFKNHDEGQGRFSNRHDYDFPDFDLSNERFTQEQTAQVDYAHKIKKMELEAGFKGIFRLQESEYAYFSFNPPTDQFEKDPQNSNAFTNILNIYGAYASVMWRLEKWDYRIGVRAEETTTRAQFLTQGSGISRNYFNLIPSVLINRKLGSTASINAGYTQRIKRPGIHRLNPFIDRSNPNFESSGNPALQPVLLNTFQLGYGFSKKLSVNAGLEYSYTKNMDLKISTYDANTNITRVTYENTGKLSALIINANSNWPITQKWNWQVNGNMAYFEGSGLVGDATQQISRAVFNFFSSSSYQLKGSWRAGASVNYRTKSITQLQGLSNAYTSSSFSLNKEFPKLGLSVGGLVNNPFTTYRAAIVETISPDFYERQDTQSYFRSFRLSLNYKFGGMKASIKKNKRGIKNDDLAN